MTELQILRNALFDEIARVKRGTSNAEDTKNIISASNAIVQTYNTELKAVELMIKVQESGADLKGVEVKVFEDDKEKNLIDYKAKDEDWKWKLVASVR